MRTAVACTLCQLTLLQCQLGLQGTQREDAEEMILLMDFWGAAECLFDYMDGVIVNYREEKSRQLDRH
jgi:hypothetical protein